MVNNTGNGYGALLFYGGSGVSVSHSYLASNQALNDEGAGITFVNVFEWVPHGP